MWNADSEWAAALAFISTISKIVRSTFIIMSCGEGAIILWRAIYNKERGLVLTWRPPKLQSFSFINFKILGQILGNNSSLLLALVLVDLQNTCKKKLNRKMLERPNICYIFGKLGVQGCQIWHSHVSIPFNLAATHSTRPHNAKKALYVIISGEILEN